MSSNQRNVRVRVDFVVREICDDGSVPEDELRFIRMGDDVAPTHVSDFFTRVGNAINLIFPPIGDQQVYFADRGPNKINLIKLLRDLGSYGLNDARQLVDAPLGTPILIIRDSSDVSFVCQEFDAVGAKVCVTPYVRRKQPNLGHLPDPVAFIRK